MEEDEIVAEASATVVVVPAFPMLSPPPTTFTYFTERYFSQYIIRNCKGVEGNNVRLLLHSNGLCLVCMDPSHFLIQSRSKYIVKQVSHSLKKDRAEPIKPQGKRKKNALLCQRDMVICFIDVEHADGVVAPVADAPPSHAAGGADGVVEKTLGVSQQVRLPACVDGLILEINPYLTKKPELLLLCPLTEGFIAVVNPHAKMNFDALEKISTATSGEVTIELE